MKKSPYHFFVTSCLVLALLLGGQSRGQAFVWCITAAGQTHVELMDDGRDTCRDEAPPERTAGIETTLTMGSAAGCGPCLDLSVADSYRQRSDSAAQLQIPATRTLPPVLLPPRTLHHSTSLHVDVPPWRNPNLLLLQTTILLI